MFVGPPVIHPQKPITVVRRFETDAAVTNGAWDLAKGHQQFLIATTSVLAYCTLDEWRIKSITGYAPFQDTLQEGNIIIIPGATDLSENFFNSRSMAFQDTTLSRDRCARVKYVPIKGDPVGSWHVANTVNSTGQLFTVTCTPGAVLDIEFEILQNYCFPVSGYSLTIVAGAVGSQYARAFASTFIPQGVNYI